MHGGPSFGVYRRDLNELTSTTTHAAFKLSQWFVMMFYCALELLLHDINYLGAFRVVC